MYIVELRNIGRSFNQNANRGYLGTENNRINLKISDNTCKKDE